MNDLKIAITGWAGISALGMKSRDIWNRYLDDKHYFKKMRLHSEKDWGSPLSEEVKEKVYELTSERPHYKQLDPAVLYAILSSRNAVHQAGWNDKPEFGVNIGSSRGATHSFEKYHTQFIENGRQLVNPFTSPVTTLGNISSWVAADLGSEGPAISHSITCSTALHAVTNGIAWLKAGLCVRFLAGGSEAPLTAFTIAQMKALKIYSSLDDKYPCRSMDPGKKHNSMILGEGAASFCLETGSTNALAYITGIGYGTESIGNSVSVSANALCLQKSMRMAIKMHDPESIDVIVLHSPGTILGDRSEMNAIKAVFNQSRPLLTSNKWKIGHTFGASGALSMEMALLMLKENQFITSPFFTPQHGKSSIKKIMVNALGFGGNAVSIIMEK